FSWITGAQISGSNTSVSAFEATVHGKFWALEKGGILPWIQVGIGLHRLNSKLELPIAALQAAGASLSEYDPDNISHQLGAVFGAGVDLPITPQTKLSLDASYHFIFLKEGEPNQLTAIAIGVSLLDVRR